MIRHMISIDPASMRVGVCYAKVFEEGKIDVIDARVLKPPKRVSSCPMLRIEYLTDSVERFIDEMCKKESVCFEVLIEVPSGRVNRSRHGGGGSGLAVYGMAVGAIFQMLRYHVEVTNIITVNESWTQSFSKKKRQSVTKSLWPKYEPTKDKEADIADAVSMTAWAKQLGNKL